MEEEEKEEKEGNKNGKVVAGRRDVRWCHGGWVGTA